MLKESIIALVVIPLVTLRLITLQEAFKLNPIDTEAMSRQTGTTAALKNLAGVSRPSSSTIKMETTNLSTIPGVLKQILMNPD